MRLRKLWYSSAFRLALLYGSVSLVLMIGLLSFIYWATAGYMDRQINATIEEEIRGLAEQYRARGLSGLSDSLALRIRDPANQAAIYLLTDADYTPLIGNIEAWPQVNSDSHGWIRFSLGQAQPEASAKPHWARAQGFQLHQHLHLLVGRNLQELEATRSLILEALAWGLLLTTLLALGIGALISSRVMRRLDAINLTSREIMSGDLSQRIPILGTGDDFDQLAQQLNAMLERIEKLMQAVQQVSDNIAHDLRTPLTRLRTRLEQLGDELAQRPALMEQAIADTDDLLNTFNALLRIARIESGSQKVAHQSLALEAILKDIEQLYEAVASERQQSLSLSIQSPCRVLGDRDLLFQLFANLVDNAIKYSPIGSQVSIELVAENSTCMVTISDQGPGIPKSLQQKVFQRFFRTDSSRSSAGNGLGLSLVWAILEMHGGEIALSNSHPGLQVRLKFKRQIAL